MTEGDKMLLAAQIQSITIVEMIHAVSMKTKNDQRIISGESMAYTEEDFLEVSGRIADGINKLTDNL